MEYLIFDISVVPQQEQVRQAEAEAEVKTSSVVDLGVPAAQQEGEDGQSKEEQTNSNKHNLQPL